MEDARIFHAHQNATEIQLMDRYEVEGHEVPETGIKTHGNGAHIYVPKAWTGMTVKVVHVTDPSDNE